MQKATLSLATVLALASGTVAQVVVPNASTAAEGDGTFALTSTTAGGRTFQLTIDASQLLSIVGQQITGLRWRQNGPGTAAWPPVPANYASWDVFVGPGVDPSAASNTFASNFTSTPTQVRSGAFSFAAGSFSFGSSPNAFGPSLDFTTPYVYTGGDLTIEMRFATQTGATTQAPLDAVLASGGPANGWGVNFSSRWTGSATGTTGNNANFPVMQVIATPGGPTGACCLTSGASNCIVTTSAACATQGGTYAGDNVTCAAANCAPLPTGACCKTDGTCEALTQVACQAISGALYSGNNITCANANCAAGGACCLFSSCSILTSAACIATGGTWLGASSACAACPTPYAEVGDAGELPGTAQTPTGAGALVGITGTLTTSDADMYKIRVCDAANFSAATVGLSTVDTNLSIYRSDGTGVAWNDDHVVIPPEATTLQSRLTNQFVGPAGNGDYYLAVAQFNKLPQGASGSIWINDNTAGHEYRSERAPDGPGAAQPISGWTTITGTGGTYGIRLAGVCFPGASCYANCDGSTGSPALTANDFQCFINKYAANDTYANCDGSTGNPALTANDFQCFINKYAGGCS